MEDPYKSKPNAADDDDAKDVVDLTPDMVLSEQAKVQIIDLTEDIIDKSAPRNNQQPKESLGIKPTMAPAPPESSSPVEDTDPKTVEEDTDPKTVEQEVDNAFEGVDEPAFSQESTESLFDDLSDIPEQVDIATDSSSSDSNRADDGSEEMSLEAPETDVDEISLAAAEIESAMSGSSDDEDDDEIIELTDIADQRAVHSASLQADEDDEIIELIDIVDPNDLLAAPLADAENDDILELTDIVHPVQPVTEPALLTKSQEKPAEDAESTPEITSKAFDPQDLALSDETADADIISIESETFDDQIDEAASQIAAALSPEDDLFEDEDETALLLDEELSNTDAETDDESLSIGAIEIDEKREQGDNGVIHLNDVLRRSPSKTEKIPIEQIKMGADEDLAQEPISLEAEESANALGLDLEQETHDKEKKPLTEQEIEAAVEKIIQDKYADTIEQLIANAVEKAVTREMETIKQAMMDGEDPLAG